MSDFFSKCWKYILGLIAVLAGLFFYERNRRKTAEEKVESNENTTDNLVTQVKLDNLSEQLKEEKRKLEEEKGRKLTDKELEEWLRKN